MMCKNLFTPWAQGSRIKVIVGHYGSGKTEIALNLALDAKLRGYDTCLVDMDIVNPFFRSAEQNDLLRARGIRSIYPPYALSGVDLSVLPPDVARVFADKRMRSVLDVGGDDAGAAALGGYKARFDQENADVYCVVNLFRPFSETKEQILSMLSRIALRARLFPTGLINNANLGEWTEPDHLLEAQRVLESVSDETGIPVVAITGKPDVLARFSPQPIPLFPVTRWLKTEWMDS